MRKGRYVPLSRQPLVLALCQVRFSTVQVGDYIPAIQEEFRRKGLPIERAGKVQQLIFAPGGRGTDPGRRTAALGIPHQGRILEHPGDVG